MVEVGIEPGTSQFEVHHFTNRAILPTSQATVKKIIKKFRIIYKPSSVEVAA
jgi:hypothetical protein